MSKKILVGITGGIAAYKTIELIRTLRKAGHQVKTIVTKRGLDFVTPLTLKTISGETVYVDNVDYSSPEIEHISLSLWCDAFLIAPASANTLAKIAQGIADNLLTSSVLSLPEATPLLICPAMNTRMWEKAVTKNNMTKIEDFYKNSIVIPPRASELACGETGIGAMALNEEIVKAINKVLGA
ncbi:MAG: flavoprotein [Candidatus Margulisbacteria bacterium]|nr:flavoprotein [Candidatus Margulisiibacteriota bacterium]